MKLLTFFQSSEFVKSLMAAVTIPVIGSLVVYLLGKSMKNNGPPILAIILGLKTVCSPTGNTVKS